MHGLPQDEADRAVLRRQEQVQSMFQQDEQEQVSGSLLERDLRYFGAVLFDTASHTRRAVLDLRRWEPDQAGSGSQPQEREAERIALQEMQSDARLLQGQLGDLLTCIELFRKRWDLA